MKYKGRRMKRSWPILRYRTSMFSGVTKNSQDNGSQIRDSNSGTSKYQTGGPTNIQRHLGNHFLHSNRHYDSMTNSYM
jgi:hypothetical protein